jgi:deazaflavin-dependent oxidoreductase (nitroreductase family)
VNERQRTRRKLALFLWRLFNPVARSLAGIAPWWVVLETRGRKTGQPRQVPLARGPADEHDVWLIAVHGAYASFARNLAADPRVRLKISGQWRQGTASLVAMDPAVVGRFSRYARAGPATFGIEPKLVRVTLD